MHSKIQGAGEGAADGAEEGAADGLSLSEYEGASLGLGESALGESEGLLLGESLGDAEGLSLGELDGFADGLSLGQSVGLPLGVALGEFDCFSAGLPLGDPLTIWRSRVLSDVANTTPLLVTSGRQRCAHSSASSPRQISRQLSSHDPRRSPCSRWPATASCPTLRVSNLDLLPGGKWQISTLRSRRERLLWSAREAVRKI